MLLLIVFWVPLIVWLIIKAAEIADEVKAGNERYKRLKEREEREKQKAQ